MSILRAAILSALLLGLPMAGVWLAGLPADRYLEFPPGTLYVSHADFSWTAFAGLVLMELVVLILLFGAFVARARTASSSQLRFPSWGYAGVALMAGTWVLAWSRFTWMGPFQAHTFTPLWISYVLVVNAVTFWRTGRCLITHDTAYFLKLIPVSAGFWWFFEYLNRFVQNWTYQGTDQFSSIEYLLFATLSFSTVLPAVMSTEELLASFGWRVSRDDEAVAPGGSLLWNAAFGLCAVALLLIGVFPNALFPFLWLAPIGIFGRFMVPVSRVTRGQLYRLAFAALVCGFFWEMWNHFSHAKWIYHVPFVERFKIFEMPLLGYFGYLPFGVECGIIAACLSRKEKSSHRRPEA